MPVPDIKSAEEFDGYLQNSTGLIVDFTSAQCGPCIAIAPLMEDLYANIRNIDIIKVETQKNFFIAARYNVTATPTFVFFHNAKEVNRIQGAAKTAIVEGARKLSELVGPEGERYQKGVDLHKQSPEYTEVGKYISPGFEVLNGSINFGEFESLNATPINSNDGKLSVNLIQDVVRITPESDKGTTIVSDADSQLLLHIPINSFAKVSSILIKMRSTGGGGVDDVKYEGEDIQRPNHIKIWNNELNIIGFETSVSPLHDETLVDEKWSSNGWYEVKLMYVRFQKVTSIDILLDGDDEDGHTAIERVLLIGKSGDNTKTAGNSVVNAGI